MLRGLLVRLIVLVGLPIAFLRPFYGLLLYLWFSHARPNDFIWPEYAFQKGAILLAAATLLGYLLFEIRHSPPRLRGLTLIPIFWLWLALATVGAAVPTESFWKLSQFAHIFVMTFLVAAMANSESRVRTLLYTLGISVGMLGSKGALDFILTGGQARMNGPGGLTAEQNEYALVLNMGIAILWGLSNTQDSRAARLGLRAMALGCAITVVGTRSRSGFLGLLAAALLLTFYSRRKVLGIAVLAIASVLFVKYAPQAAMKRYESISTAAEDDSSAIGRLQAWQTAWAMIKAHPVLGVGPFNFIDVFPQYSSFHPRAPHNAYVALAAESGIPSCLLFLAILGSTMGQMWVLRKRLRHHPGNGKLAEYCLIVQTTLLVYMVPNFFINRQNLDLMYHVVGVGAGLAFVVRQRLAEPAVEPEQPELQEEAAMAV